MADRMESPPLEDETLSPVEHLQSWHPIRGFSPMTVLAGRVQQMAKGGVSPSLALVSPSDQVIRTRNKGAPARDSRHRKTPPSLASASRNLFTDRDQLTPPAEPADDKESTTPATPFDACLDDLFTNTCGGSSTDMRSFRPASAPPARSRRSPLTLPPLASHISHGSSTHIASSAIPIPILGHAVPIPSGQIRLASSPAANPPVSKRSRDTKRVPRQFEERDEEQEELRAVPSTPTTMGMRVDVSPATMEHIEAYQYAGSHHGASSGDGSPCNVPVLGDCSDFPRITPATLQELLSGLHRDGLDQVEVVDCRFPYEYAGGHIQGAVNLFEPTDIRSIFTKFDGAGHRVAIVFHCEFSSQRAPRMCSHLRKMDRELNREAYPRLCFPKLFILEGGYKAFYLAKPALCEPQAYVPMNSDEQRCNQYLTPLRKAWKRSFSVSDVLSPPVGSHPGIARGLSVETLALPRGLGGTLFGTTSQTGPRPVQVLSANLESEAETGPASNPSPPLVPQMASNISSPQ
eukprot:m.131792 g.131792  ORF g.131792 m.131792 type:complete len:518 (+) comp9476_c0_seq7:9876-11429(+)